MEDISIIIGTKFVKEFLYLSVNVINCMYQMIMIVSKLNVDLRERVS